MTSRAGLSQAADFLIRPDTNLLALPINEKLIHCVLVDEAQFLLPTQVDQLRVMTQLWRVPIICYGLRTDFRTNLFPGSKRLMEVCDSIEEVKTTCHYCNSKAVMNLKHVNGKADTEGPAVQLGAEEKYFPTCFKCYRQQLNDAGQAPVSVWGPKTDVLYKHLPNGKRKGDVSTVGGDSETAAAMDVSDKENGTTALGGISENKEQLSP